MPPWQLRGVLTTNPHRLLRGSWISFRRERKELRRGIWPLEVANALLVAERRKRISVAQVTALLGRIVQLPVSVETSEPDRAFSQVLSVARQHQLTEYDAAYVELAREEAYLLQFVHGFIEHPLARKLTSCSNSAQEHLGDRNQTLDQQPRAQ